MRKAIIKLYFRSLRRQKLHFLIAAGSLATGMTCFVLFYFSFQYERSFDRSHVQADSIFEVRYSLTSTAKRERRRATACPSPRPWLGRSPRSAG